MMDLMFVEKKKSRNNMNSSYNSPTKSNSTTTSSSSSSPSYLEDDIRTPEKVEGRPESGATSASVRGMIFFPFFNGIFKIKDAGANVEL